MTLVDAVRQLSRAEAENERLREIIKKAHNELASGEPYGHICCTLINALKQPPTELPNQ